MVETAVFGGASIDDRHSGLEIKVRGIVQGVGFRPFIFNLAESLGLAGTVKNTSGGVEIELDGPQENLDRFLTRLRSELPPLARIDFLESKATTPHGYANFAILQSSPAPGDFLPVPPDIAICADCRLELFSPSDRRFRYPFINCTNCGPRFSIIHALPYDRPLTTMAGFPMCKDCAGEYHDPRNRRFHAQPVACPSCGPNIWLEADHKRLASGEDTILQARRMLSAGKILAIKGLGGFHLACDATNVRAVETLRSNKKRSDKPFAIMAFGLDQARRHCLIDPDSQSLLLSRQAPIVLLPRLSISTVAEAVAPAQDTLGLMLAYTPLHLLLLEPAPDFPEILVMTSGNLSEEPIAYRDDDALERLTPLADAFLLHNRPIHIRVDDSVAASVRGSSYFFRRSRGYAPDPLSLPFDAPPLLAAGAELKNTFCLARDRYAFLSHHIGDLENYETLQSFEEGISHFERLFRVRPQALACDLHPDYLATRYANERSRTENLPLMHIQHHHAHLAACLVDHQYIPGEPVIGLSYDGTGMGTDGAVWGGEILIGSYTDYRRRFHLAYTPLPGGDLAVRTPARMALSHLWQAEIEWEPDLPPVQYLCADERSIVNAQIERKINSPMTSSMGRLFDAVASLIGLRHKVTYEGQAAVELEAFADPKEKHTYPVEIKEDQIFAGPLLLALIADWRAGISLPILAARFHNSIAQLSLEACRRIRSEGGPATVALSGGVWQNRFLLNRTLDILEADGFKVLIHHRLPTNDACIAVGQAAILAAYLNGIT